mgnify:CR=1 FL=1
MMTFDTVTHSREIFSNNIRIKSWNTPSSTHSHDFFEIIYVKEGSILHSINNSPYTRMYQGDYMFIDIGSHHSFDMENSTIVNVEFTSHAISKHLPLCNNIFQLLAYSAFSVISSTNSVFPSDKILHDDCGRLSTYIDILKSEIYEENDDEHSVILPYIIKHNLIAIMLHIVRPYLNQPVYNYENVLVKKMLEIVAFHYADPNPLAIAASQLSYSPSTLSTLFKNNTGKKYKEYIQCFRIDKAKHLLTSTSTSILKIAEDVGYVDTKFFSRIFKKYEGITPTEYRKKNRNNVPVISIAVEELN